MAQIMSYQGSVALMSLWQTAASGWTVNLYQNNHTPAYADTSAAYVNCTYAGYAPQTPVLGAPFLNGSNQGESDMTALVFAVSGVGVPNQVYGYYILDGSGNLLFAELFTTGPFNMVNPGDTITLNDAFLLASMF